MQTTFKNNSLKKGRRGARDIQSAPKVSLQFKKYMYHKGN